MVLWNKKRPDAVKGLAAGLIGGLVASWAMNRFQDALARLSRDEGDGPGVAPSNGQGPQPAKQEGEASEPATVKAAVAIAEEVLHRPISSESKPAAGTAVHYAFGALTGGLYGAASEWLPAVRAGSGTLFGGAVWLFGDEVAVPAFGLAEGPRSYPWKVHASALAAHLVFGGSLELARRALRSGLLAR